MAYITQKLRLKPKDPTYFGCYYRVSKTGLTTYYVKKWGKFYKVGTDADGITPVYVKNYRGALTTENIDKVYPTPNKLKRKEEAALTLDQAWDIWTKWAASNIKAKTFAPDEARYRIHIQPHLGSKRLDKIITYDIEMLRPGWEKAGLQKNTQKQIVVLIGRIFNTLSNLGKYAGVNPAKRVKMKNTKRNRVRMLSYAQTKALLDECRKINYAVYLQATLAVYSGMRLNEVMGLQPKDINWEDGILTIENVKSTTKEYKTRYVFFGDDPMLRSALEQIHDRFYRGDNQPYFSNEYSRYYYMKAVDALGLNDGIDPRDQVNRVGFHTLRHSFASQFLAANGGNLHELKEALGHDDINSTMIYSHLANEQKQKAQKNLALARAKAWKQESNLKVIEGGA